MVATFQNFDRLMGMLAHGKLVSNPTGLIPREQSPFFNPLGYWKINRDMQNLPIRVSREDGQVVLEAPMPGVRPEDIEVLLENDSLKISGKFSEKTTLGERELSEQKIPRPALQARVELPSDLDPNRATTIYENGLLTITIPKIVAEPGKRLIVQVKDSKNQK
jgi:HSP20 family protein